jgi:hypothetical protein
MYMYMYTDFWAFRCVSICANCNSALYQVIQDGMKRGINAAASGIEATVSQP